MVQVFLAVPDAVAVSVSLVGIGVGSKLLVAVLQPVAITVVVLAARSDCRRRQQQSHRGSKDHAGLQTAHLVHPPD